MSLAKDLWEILSDDPDLGYNVPNKQKILDRIEDDLRKTIGDQDYDKLDKYITNNKDDDDLHDLVEDVADETLPYMLPNLDFFSMEEEEDIEDFVVDFTHYSLKRLYDRLEKSNYDAGKALTLRITLNILSRS